MVLSTIKLKIENTLKQKVLSPEDFRFLLAKHTEQINAMKEMIVDKRVCFFSFQAYEFQTKYSNFEFVV